MSDELRVMSNEYESVRSDREGEAPAEPVMSGVLPMQECYAWLSNSDILDVSCQT
jgi:hypothetical protein